MAPMGKAHRLRAHASPQEVLGPRVLPLRPQATSASNCDCAGRPIFEVSLTWGYNNHRLHESVIPLYALILPGLVAVRAPVDPKC